MLFVLKYEYLRLFRFPMLSVNLWFQIHSLDFKKKKLPHYTIALGSTLAPWDGHHGPRLHGCRQDSHVHRFLQARPAGEHIWRIHQRRSERIPYHNLEKT